MITITFHVLEKLQLENLQILSVYVKRWRPSKHVIDDFGEVLLKSGTIEEFKEKVRLIFSFWFNCLLDVIAILFFNFEKLILQRIDLHMHMGPYAYDFMSGLPA